MKYLKLFEGKSFNYDFAEAFAKKHNINYTIRTNEYNHNEEVVFYGTAKEFFEQKKEAKFSQITEPDGFDKNSTGKNNIEIAVYTGKTSENGNKLSTKIPYKVNYKLEDIK